MPSIRIYAYLLVFLALCCKLLKGQTIPFSEKQVTLKVINLSYQEAFKLISSQTGVIFSYGQNFNDKQRVSFIATKKNLRLLLSEILTPIDAVFSFKGKYVVIKYVAGMQPPSVVKGYIYNTVDSSTIKDASIYLKQSKHSAISDEYGHFKVSYSSKTPTVSVSFAKEGFRDTSIIIYKPAKQEIVIYLLPRKVKLDTTLVQRNLNVDTIPTKLIVDTIISSVVKEVTLFWKNLRKKNPNLRNITDTLFSNVSISLIPFVSTNHLLSLNTVNKVSVNVLGGYSRGVTIAEIGGLFNVNHGNVSYVQLAGLGNFVSGSVKGFQAAGLLNAVHGNMKGLQCAGIGNFNWGSLRGVQVSGVFNFNRKAMNGWQVTGIVNGATRSVRGGQIAGITNIALDTIARAQVAGIVNVAKVNTTTQISGVLNVAKVNNGFQLGLINFADTSAGIPLGFLSFVRKGYHKLELSADELGFTSLSFGTGVEKLHNVFTVGINISHPDIVAMGYGLGSTFKLKNKMLFNADLVSQQLKEVNSNWDYSHVLNKLYVGIEFKAQKYLRFGLGPVLNVMICDTADPLYNAKFQSLAPYEFSQTAIDTYKVNMWVGGKVSVKFL